MDDLPGLPSEVPQEYREELVKFQKQIKILLNNYRVSKSANFFYIYTLFVFSDSCNKISEKSKGRSIKAI